MTILIAGVDEVGRGPLAGPVVAAAVILTSPIANLKDSKKLTVSRRKALAQQIKAEALCFAYGRAEVEEIDRINIHQATLLAMKRAVDALPMRPESILVDGLHAPEFGIPTKTIVQGDNSVPEISAASIIAKVLRDDEMLMMDAVYPGYGFADHKGYGTAAHLRALETLGPCTIHRRSFAPVARLLMQVVKEDSMAAD